MVHSVNEPATESSASRIPSCLEQETGRLRFGREDHASSNLPQADLANDIAARLWSRLPFSRLLDETGHRGIEHVVRVASSSHTQILEWHAELSKFRDAICEAAIELRGDELSPEFRTGLVGEIRRKMIDKGSGLAPPRPLVDYQFADLDADEATAQGRLHFEQACSELANRLFTVLEHLRANRIVGRLVDGNETCRFSFHRRVAIVDRAADSRVEERRKVDARFKDHWHQAYFIDTYESTPVHVQHRDATHTHDVRNPILRDINKTKYRVPQKYLDLFDACPSWIQADVRVLEGDLIREERIERDTSSEQRADETLLSSRWERCPAIVLGDFVLAGWNEQAIVGEETRARQTQLEERSEASRLRGQRCKTATRVVGCLGVAMMALSFLGGSALVFVAILLGLTAMFLASQSVQFGSGDDTSASPSIAIFHSLQVGSVIFCLEAILYAAIHLSLPAFALFACLVPAAVYLSRVNHDASQPDG